MCKIVIIFDFFNILKWRYFTLGLNDKEVLELRKKYGSNEITRKKSNTFFKILLESLSDPIIKILLIALSIKIVFLFKNFDWYETLGIVIAIFLASFISSISEYGSNKAFERLFEESSKLSTKVYRNGKLTTISSKEIVINDLLEVSSGDKICADGIIKEGSLQVDESFITGESKEVNKKIGDKVYSYNLDNNSLELKKVLNTIKSNTITPITDEPIIINFLLSINTHPFHLRLIIQ